MFWESTPFFRTTLPIFRTPGAIRLVPRRWPKAGGSPFNAVSTVPVGRQAMPGDARKGGTTMNVIASIRNDFQENLVFPGKAASWRRLCLNYFEPDYRSAEALRGLEGFSHIWLIWAFSASAGKGWSPTVRPPRLGGNARVGVFASRSPFRPNPLGLSAVKLENIMLQSPEGPLLRVSGADLLHGTPILDIKPYLPYADCIPRATGGFAGTKPEPRRGEVPLRESCKDFRRLHGRQLREVLARRSAPVLSG